MLRGAWGFHLFPLQLDYFFISDHGNTEFSELHVDVWGHGRCKSYRDDLSNLVSFDMHSMLESYSNNENGKNKQNSYLYLNKLI